MRGPAPVRLVAAVLAAATLVGCGPDDVIAGPTRSFESDGFGITFEYPDPLEERTPRGGDGGPGRPDDIVREVILTDDDFIAVRRDPVAAELGAAGGDALKPVVDQLAEVLNPKIGPGRPITVGGMPGFEYLGISPGVEHRYLFFLGRDVLYLVHCRSTEEHRVQIIAACDTVQRTLRPA